MYLQNLDPELKDVEFIEMLHILDPTRGKYIKYYQLRAGIKKFLTASIRRWLGEILNKYDETKKSLGMVLKGDKKKLKKKYSKDTFQTAFNTFRRFKGGQFSIFLEVIEVEEDYSLNISWKSLRLKLKELLTRYNLRNTETIQNFLSSKEPTAKDKDASAREEELHLEFLSNLRQKMKILNKGKAGQIFDKVDTNKSGAMTLHEFEDFIAYKIPNTE